MEKQNKNGGYDIEGIIWHQHSNHLMLQILKHFKKDTSVVDIGCGLGYYVGVLNCAGYEAMGFDAVNILQSRYIYEYDITRQNPKLNNPFKRNVISLEVGEHIPPHLSDNYIDNLTSFEGDILMSWAVEGQAGIGHINCRNNDWVINQMDVRGYELNQEITNELRKSVENCHCTWFKNTLMYFQPKSFEKPLNPLL